MKWSGRTDGALGPAVLEMTQGLIDADPGGHVVEKRIAITGHGKRGAARTIVATQLAEHWFFIYGFLGLDEREMNIAVPRVEIIHRREEDDC